MKHHPFHDWGHHEPYGHLPPFRFWLQTSLPAIYDDSLTYLELAGRLHWYIDQIINTLKVYDDKFCELMGLYDELEEYVRCYFDRANFPDMVKDILDDMAATGHLSEILLQYIGDFSIDPKKIKGGIVPVHYVYDHTENGIEYFKRTESDEEVLTILRNGSIVLGVFKDSPSNGSFISYMKRANFVYNGTVKEFECGCVNTVYTKDFTITYEDYVRDADDFIRSVVITDHYGEDTYLEVYPVNADLPDGYVSDAKLADKSVTHPKIADDAVWENNIKNKSVTHPKIDDDAVWGNNIKDGAVTPDKLAKGKIIMLGDIYDLVDGGWSAPLISNLGLQDRAIVNSVDGGGFVGNNNTTFLKQLQTVAGNMSEYDKRNTTYILCGGGNDDRGKEENAVPSAIAAFGNYVKSNFPNAKVIVAQFSWRNPAVAGGGRSTYLQVTREYEIGCGKAGFRFVANSPFCLHEDAMFNATGWQPNASGLGEIARMFGIELAGGTYDRIGPWREVTYTVDPALNLGGVAQKNLFPSTNPDTTPFKVTTMMHNNYIYEWYDFHTIEFKTPTTLMGHLTDGEHGEKGAFNLLSIDTMSAYAHTTNNSDFRSFPCSVVDSSGNVTNAELLIRRGSNFLQASLYKVKEKTTDKNIGIEFEIFENVKFIHMGVAIGKFEMNAWDG